MLEECQYFERAEAEYEMFNNQESELIGQDRQKSPHTQGACNLACPSFLGLGKDNETDHCTHKVKLSKL